VRNLLPLPLAGESRGEGAFAKRSGCVEPRLPSPCPLPQSGRGESGGLSRSAEKGKRWAFAQCGEEKAGGSPESGRGKSAQGYGDVAPR
jgi:hypothetical protein